jgi:TRAP-type C4-dicarboxylate transport system permease small subunit
MGWMEMWSARLTRVAEALLVLAFTGMGVAILTQIVLRAMGRSLLIMEDVAFFGFFWLVFSGVAVAFQRRGHVAVDFVVQRFPPRAQRITEIFAQGAVLGFLLLFTWSGVRLTLDNIQQHGMQLRISMAYVYWVLPLGGVISAVAVLGHFCAAMRQFRNPADP